MKKIEEMRITIEDLESLKTLNDEMEEHHMETEKAMQDDISELPLRFKYIFVLRKLIIYVDV